MSSLVNLAIAKLRAALEGQASNEQVILLNGILPVVGLGDASDHTIVRGESSPTGPASAVELALVTVPRSGFYDIFAEALNHFTGPYAARRQVNFQIRREGATSSMWVEYASLLEAGQRWHSALNGTRLYLDKGTYLRFFTSGAWGATETGFFFIHIIERYR